MNVLGLDLGNTTGWASSRRSGVVSGVWRLDFGLKKADRPFRLNRLYHHLGKLVETVGCPSIVAYEQPGNLKGHARKVIPAYQGIVEFWTVRMGVGLRVYTATEVKKFATGKGRADKETMIEAAVKRWGDREFEYHDEADALWIMQICLEEGNC